MLGMRIPNCNIRKSNEKKINLSYLFYVFSISGMTLCYYQKGCQCNKPLHNIW